MILISYKKEPGRCKVDSYALKIYMHLENMFDKLKAIDKLRDNLAKLRKVALSSCVIGGATCTCE